MSKELDNCIKESIEEIDNFDTAVNEESDLIDIVSACGDDNCDEDYDDIDIDDVDDILDDMIEEV